MALGGQMAAARDASQARQATRQDNRAVRQDQRQQAVGQIKQGVSALPGRMKSGGKVDGAARRGKTKGRMC